MDDAIVRTCENRNRMSLAEMTKPAYAVTNLQIRGNPTTGSRWYVLAFPSSFVGNSNFVILSYTE